MYCDYIEADEEENESIIPLVGPSHLVDTVEPKVVAFAALVMVDSPIPTPRHQPSTSRIPTLLCMSSNVQTLSQILAIPTFVSTKAKKRTSALHCHGRLITSEAFLAEIKEKEDNATTKILALENKRKAKKDESLKKKEEKENKKIEIMVKRWIKEMEKKVD